MFQLQEGWMDPLLNHPVFTQIKHKTEVAEGEVITTFTDDQKDEKRNAKFYIELRYRYA